MNKVENTVDLKFLKKFSKDVTYNDWNDYKWQISNSIKSLDMLENVLEIKFPDNERKEIQKAIEVFPMSITPYYASLIDISNLKKDPIYKQSVASKKELIMEDFEMEDPLAEDKDSPVIGITHRYPDRVLFYVNPNCAMYCRHCTRKRKVSESESNPSKEEIQKAIDYIKEHPEVRDVLLSGGDPLLLSDDYLDWILSEISSIEHVELIRIGSRVPVVLPQRITDNLVNILKKYHPIWVNTHFNHVVEITDTSVEALDKLSNAGIPIGNQTVLLSGVNDCPYVMRKLNQKLVSSRVRPYYLYQCDLSKGISHFRTSISKGLEIIESLIGHTTGFAVPRYVVDAPGGGGKIPVMPNYVVSWGSDRVILRNYEGVITTYKEPSNYEGCSKNCNKCSRLSIDDFEINQTGIEKLITNVDTSISLVPSNNKRMCRREK
ncbi:lysine 2,3-aminomutase YodO family protein [Methanococcus vannielii SB]|uniref:L-lysine 2,3-aminomutase n=1 Tax=Methanococcus vannielii (strain ATCC 35089 / DSM 1224 / JCM 13029 / OCM 148 / SB) TaxID=406327 RepID=A6URJ9_METVS|nr:lysine 2,3-aminomutase [Methanococcus vannielii]ABR55121.1 lysine 2,3-aminomutase YodO family protein [Methanococcus vannielii SB]